MLISDVLSTERIRSDVHSSSKKRLLELISEELARSSSELDQREFFESLIARERLGSTGLGNGVAIPHGRVKGIEGDDVLFEAIGGKLQRLPLRLIRRARLEVEF